MSAQLSVFDAPLARRRDPATSHIAAASMQAGAAAHRALILAVLRDGLPRTYVEIASATRLDPIAVARRMAELLRAGLVRRLPETRLTPSGRPAHLWKAA